MLTGLTRTLSWVICGSTGQRRDTVERSQSCPWGRRATHLLERICVEQNPSKLNNLGRVLGDVDAVLIARRGHMDHDIAVDVDLGLRGHDGRRRLRARDGRGRATSSAVDLVSLEERRGEGAAACDRAGSGRSFEIAAWCRVGVKLQEALPSKKKRRHFGRHCRRRAGAGESDCPKGQGGRNGVKKRR